MAREGPVLTRAEVRDADAYASQVLGLPTCVLMENAGRGLATVTHAEAIRYDTSSVVVVAARGNNGGDGLVAARHLLRLGLNVRVVLAVPEDRFEGDPAIHLRAARNLGIPVSCERGDLAGSLVVDAVLGTGLEGPVEGPLVDVLRWLQECGRPVVAADLPSGLDADTGALLGPVPRCVATATFLCLKPGLLRGEGPSHAGRVEVCDIGIPVPRAGSPPTSPP